MNKIYLLLLVTILVAQTTYAQNRADEIRRKLVEKDTTYVMVVAHRGDWRYAPENSLPAIKNAIEMGVDIVEIDIQRTKDGHLILMHDSRLERTTTGKGRVDEWTLDSLRTLNLKNGCAIRTKEKIPTLEEVLVFCKGKVMINLDKADKYFDEIFPLLEKTGTTGQIIMKGSKTPDVVQKEFGKYLDKVIYMPIVNLDKIEATIHIQDFQEHLQPLAYEMVYADPANPLPLLLPEQLQGKSLLWYNTLWDTLAGGHDDDLALEDPDKSYGYLVESVGARILQTDRPAYLIDYLQKKGWR